MPQEVRPVKQSDGYWYLQSERTGKFLMTGTAHSIYPLWCDRWNQEGASGWTRLEHALWFAKGQGLFCLPVRPRRPPIGSEEHITETTGMGPDERSHLG